MLPGSYSAFPCVPVVDERWGQKRKVYRSGSEQDFGDLQLSAGLPQVPPAVFERESWKSITRLFLPALLEGERCCGWNMRPSVKGVSE